MVYLKKHLKKTPSLNITNNPGVSELFSNRWKKKTVLVFDKCFFVGNLTNPNTVPGVVKN